MATKMGDLCAPGVLLSIEDNSAYGEVQNPSAIAGIVGFAAKGEMNKILNISNSGAMDAILGYGYNNAKYNQGLYAARGVIDNGGVVEFVRPYGEEIDKSSPYKRDLKSDAFVVTYDRNAFRYDGQPKNSFQMKHFAATRFKTDAAADFGVRRKINNIAETVKSGKNVDFAVSAGEEFTDSKACRWYDNERKKAPTDTVLFAIINSDPSSANRAYESYDIVDVQTNLVSKTLTLTLGARPTFSVGEKLYFPITEGGASNQFASATVLSIDEFDVSVSPDDSSYLESYNRPSVAFYCSDATAVADGFDYLTVKTAVAGRGAKTFTVMNIADFAAGERFSVKDSLPNGSCIIVNDANNGIIPVRIINNEFNSLGAISFKTTDVDGNALPAGVFRIENADGNVTLFDGDVITVKFIVSASGTYTEYSTTTVTVTNAAKYLCTPNEELDGSGLDSIAVESSYISEFSEKVDSVFADISDAKSWGDVVKAIAKAFRTSAVGYNNRAVVNDIVTFDLKANKLKLDTSAALEYAVGDAVAVVLGSGTTKVNTEAEITEFMEKWHNPVVGTAKITAINVMTGEITLDAIPEGMDDTAGEHFYQLIDLTGAAMDVYASAHTIETVLTLDDTTWSEVSGGVETYGVECSKMAIENTDLDGKVQVGDVLAITDGDNSYIDPDPQTFTVVGLTGGFVIVKDPLKKLRGEGISYTVQFTKSVDIGQFFVVGAYSLYVPTAAQNAAQFSLTTQGKALATDTGALLVTDTNLVLVADYDGKAYINPGMGKDQYIVEKSSKCLASAEIGATFLGLGLATTKYEDVEFTGNPKQVYALTADGENVARLFLNVQYRFNGNVYEFEGTVVPYVLNGQTQLSIEYAAGFELADTGVSFLLNESGVLDNFLDNNSYDLSQTIYNGVLDGSSTCISFNPEDPAIVNDAVWVYQPANNMSTSTLATVWNLFLDKDGSDVSFLVSAGTNINNFGMKDIETLNTQVMSAIMTVCEARKDCFALLGGIGEAEIAKALKKYDGATSFPTTLGRWAALYDGKGRVMDNFYTHNVVDIDKSVQIAALVTANRSGSIFWYPPAGKKKGGVPSAWGTSEKYPRRYSYPEDTTSDIARLINIHVNPTRCTKKGNFFWGDWTLQMEDTAFNQIHVAMLVAGIHKMYYHYLDNYVFDLNTPEVRADIQSTIQASLDSIKNARPSGFYMAECICNETNNPQPVIDQGKLNVWLRIRPTKTARWIQLKTELVKTENGNQVTTALI